LPPPQRHGAPPDDVIDAMDLDEEPDADAQFQREFFQVLETADDRAVAISTKDFREVFGNMKRINLGERSNLFDFLIDVALDKLKGYENNSFDGELRRVKKMISSEDAKKVPTTGQELVKLMHKFLVDPFSTVIPFAFCKNGSFLSPSFLFCASLFLQNVARISCPTRSKKRGRHDAGGAGSPFLLPKV
jgi:hypothetical protein